MIRHLACLGLFPCCWCALESILLTGEKAPKQGTPLRNCQVKNSGKDDSFVVQLKSLKPIFNSITILIRQNKVGDGYGK